MSLNRGRFFAGTAATIFSRIAMSQDTPAATPAHLSANVGGPFATQPWDSDSRIVTSYYSVHRVVFKSGGLDVVGNLFMPPGGAPRPAIAVIGPVAYIKEQAPLQYASRLAREGFVTLIFDPRYHGESAGEPRRLESRAAKVEDLRAAGGVPCDPARGRCEADSHPRCVPRSELGRRGGRR